MRRTAAQTSGRRSSDRPTKFVWFEWFAVHLIRLPASNFYHPNGMSRQGVRRQYSR
jgi:hypothetical protein